MRDTNNLEARVFLLLRLEERDRVSLQRDFSFGLRLYPSFPIKTREGIEEITPRKSL